MRYFLELQYKGTNYAGWQVQDNAIAVQQKLDEALAILLQHNVNSLGCGRTDTGVHATQFFAHFDSEKEINSKEKFVFSLNGILPHDICILDLHSVHDDAHARFDATARTYYYFIHTSKNPFLKNTALFFNKPLNFDLMIEACELMKTYSDFSCFSKSRTQVKTNICNITYAMWQHEDDLLQFKISADRFLRGMVRTVVGTMLQLGEGRISINDFENILKNKNRKEAGQAVDACGLYLTEIKYSYIVSTKKNTFALKML
ncbi:MAG: tRNA pseudouridine(38-40) synthase TruA [Bacteroidia bacterium]